MFRFCGAVALLFLACFVSSCATSTRNTSHTFNTVVIDPGHGGQDSGASRRYCPPEKVLALDVSQRLNRKLRESQLKTVLTRNRDVFITLDGRVDIGNAQPNSIFVAIHFNDARARWAHGFETYYHSDYASGIAREIQDKLLTIRGSVNRGVHTANFRVLRKATYPSVLVECGFLSNKTEGRETRSASYRDLLADKVAEAIVDYRYGEGVYHSPPSAPSTADTSSNTGF